MLDNKTFMDKLYKLPETFLCKMKSKDYSGAKHCYDTARTVAVFAELDASVKTELFGERGEHGAIIKQGLFPEEQVQRAYLECIKRNETYENQKYPGAAGEMT